MLKGAVADFHDRHSNPGFERNARLTRSQRRRPSRSPLLFLERPPPVIDVSRIPEATGMNSILKPWYLRSAFGSRKPYLAKKRPAQYKNATKNVMAKTRP